MLIFVDFQAKGKPVCDNNFVFRLCCIGNFGLWIGNNSLNTIAWGVLQLNLGV